MRGDERQHDPDNMWLEPHNSLFRARGEPTHRNASITPGRLARPHMNRPKPQYPATRQPNWPVRMRARRLRDLMHDRMTPSWASRSTDSGQPAPTSAPAWPARHFFRAEVLRQAPCPSLLQGGSPRFVCGSIQPVNKRSIKEGH